MASFLDNKSTIKTAFLTFNSILSFKDLYLLSMKFSYFMISLFAGLSIASSVIGQRFSCDGQLLIATSDGTSTKISRPIYIPFNPPFLSPWASYANGSFDALGFNSRDNFIYGVQQNTNAIVRLKRNSTFDTVGIVSLVDTLNVNAGDCTVDGLYICYEQTLHQILVFDVVDNFQVIQRIDLFWDPESPNSGAFKTKIYDFAVDPNNPVLAFAYQGSFAHPDLEPAESRGKLLKINLEFDGANLGMVTPLTPVDPMQISHLGGIVFSPQSELFGFGSSEEGLNPTQNKLVSINSFTGDVSEVLKNPEVVLSDGCSCPFAFTFSNQVPTEGMYCNDDEKTFILTISNQSFNSVDNFTLIDTFPEGMIIEELNGVIMDNVEAVNGLGTHILEIIGLDIAGKSILEIKVKVRSIDAAIGNVLNQAFLYNLPERFAGVVVSDDLGTQGVEGDASRFSVIPRSLNTATWEVKSPTECLLANDGEIRVSSPQFFPGQQYEIRIRNKIGWDEFTYQIEIDQNNAFLLDSLLPGNYQVYELRSLADNCSLAIRDTTIILEAPNDLLILEMGSNGPVCEGDNLLLQSSSHPDSDIRWTGPNFFASEEFNPVVENVNENNSGEYKIQSQYGFCEQLDTLEVIVRPHINASITAPSQYCERDRMQLDVETAEFVGSGIELSYEWSGPNDLISFKSALVVPSISSEQEGYYELNIYNDACSDTVGIDIIVLPTPSISLPETIFTDFCTRINLEAVIIGDEPLVYNWLPEEGLSCADCPVPQLESIVQSNYQLVVENAYACADSAIVEIVLDKETLVYAPNIFHGGGIGENAQFRLYPACLVINIRNLEIFDRWGNRVYNGDSDLQSMQQMSWDGSINDAMVNSGVYIWTAEVELIDGSVEFINGNVTMLR